MVSFLEIIMQSEDDFYVYLSSREDANLFKENHAAAFTNKISPTRKLNGVYSVALKNIIFKPNVCKQFLNDDHTHSINFNFSFLTSTGNLGYGIEITYYPPTVHRVEDLFTFILVINDDLREFLSRNVVLLDTPETIIFLDEVTGKLKFSELTKSTIRMYPNVKCSWSFSEQLSKMLGLDRKTSDLPTPVLPVNIPEFDLRSLFVYTDIVEPSFLGGKMMHLLDILPMKNTFHKASDLAMYKRVNKDFIDTISIKLGTDTGVEPPLCETVVVILVLHFRLDKII